MNESMNDAFKKDLPNMHEWCQNYAARTGIRIYAGNPPVGLVLEDLMGKFKAHCIAVNKALEDLTAHIQDSRTENKEKKKKQ